MDVELRSIGEDELPAYVLADAYGFGERWEVGHAEGFSRSELDRTVAAFVDGEIVATGRNFSQELTLPGGAVVPAGGVSWISTRATHRRRGLLTRVMRHLIDDSHAHGEVVSILTASEGGIYPRFGYGVATRIATFAFDRAGAVFRDPMPDGARFRIVEPDVAREIAISLFERVRTSRPGVVARPTPWWFDEWASEEWIDPKRRFDVVLELDGEPAGHAMYAIEGQWREGYTEKAVAVRDLLAISPEAELALWQYLANVDQTIAVRAWNRPLDDTLPWLLTDERHVRTTAVRDFLWLRPLDTATLLASRSYGVEGALTLAVVDPFLAAPTTAGTLALDGGPAGATCVRTAAAADLTLDAAALGAISLGGIRPSVLARAGRVRAVDPAKLALADRMFAAERDPYAASWF